MMNMYIDLRARLVFSILAIVAIGLLIFHSDYYFPRKPNQVTGPIWVEDAVWVEQQNKLMIWKEGKDSQTDSTDCISFVGDKVQASWRLPGHFLSTGADDEYVGYLTSEGRLELVMARAKTRARTPEITTRQYIGTNLHPFSFSFDEKRDLLITHGSTDTSEDELKLWQFVRNEATASGGRFTEADKLKTMGLYRILRRTGDLVLLSDSGFRPAIYSYDEKTLSLHSVRTQFPVATEKGAGSYSISGDISPDERFVVLAGTYVSPVRNEVHVWEIDSGRLVISHSRVISDDIPPPRDAYSEVYVRFLGTRKILFGCGGTVNQIDIKESEGSFDFEIIATGWTYPRGNCHFIRPLSSDRCMVLCSEIESNEYQIAISNRSGEITIIGHYSSLGTVR